MESTMCRCAFSRIHFYGNHSESKSSAFQEGKTFQEVKMFQEGKRFQEGKKFQGSKAIQKGKRFQEGRRFTTKEQTGMEVKCKEGNSTHSLYTCIITMIID